MTHGMEFKSGSRKYCLEGAKCIFGQMIVFEFRLGPARHTFLGYRMGAVVCWSVFNNQHGGERHRADVYCLPVSVEQYSEHVQFF